MSRTEPDFNLIARPYRWLEYLTLGRSLENCRNHFLPRLTDRHRALVLGDGDGRFLGQLLKTNPRLQADAVDTSSTMLRLLRDRCQTAAPNANTRLQTHHCSALTFPFSGSYDLIVTHFFLDCFSQAELNALIHRIAKHTHPGTLWLISDFRIPQGLAQLPAKILVRSLYLAFRLLTGIRTSHLPDHTIPLTKAGFLQIAHQPRLSGILVSELWRI